MKMIRICRYELATISGLCAYVELANAAHATGLPPVVHEALQLADRRGVVFTPGWPFLVPRIRALAAALDHRLEEAETHFERAIRIATAVSAIPELGRARLDYALLLAARDQPRDRERAEELAQGASADLGSHGARRFAAEADKLANYLRNEAR